MFFNASSQSAAMAQHLSSIDSTLRVFLASMNIWQALLVIFLNLSQVFDTVDHKMSYINFDFLA